MSLQHNSSTSAAQSGTLGTVDGLLQRLRDDDLLVDLDEDVSAETGSSCQTSSSEEGGETSEDVEDDMDRLVAQEDLLRAMEIRLHANRRQLLELHRLVFEDPGTPVACVQKIVETQLEQRLTEMASRKDHWLLQLSRRRRRRSSGSISRSSDESGPPAATGVGASGTALGAGETLADSLAAQQILQRPVSHELRLKKKELRKGVHRFARLLARTNEIMWDYISGDDD